MSALRQFSGADAARAAEKVRQERAKQSSWPYEYLFAPPDSIPINGGTLGVQTAAVPAAGSTVTIATFLVPSGFRFIMQAIWLCFEGTFLPGDSLFTVTCNPNSGAQSNPVQGLINVPIPLGSWKFGMAWEFDRPYEFAALDFLTAVGKNVNLAPGPPNQYVAGFFGYLLPSLDRR